MTTTDTTPRFISFAAAAKLVPGPRRLSPSTVYRWHSRGVGGVKLEAVRVAGRFYTTKEAIERFLAACNETDDDRLRKEGC